MNYERLFLEEKNLNFTIIQKFQVGNPAYEILDRARLTQKKGDSTTLP